MPRSTRVHTSVQEVAVTIAEYFSDDAASWRPVHVHSWDSVTSIRFRWFAERPPDFGAGLFDVLKVILADSFRSLSTTRAVPIVWSVDDDATAEVTFVERQQEGQDGLAYELRFRDSTDLFPGWFAL